MGRYQNIRPDGYRRINYSNIGGDHGFDLCSACWNLFVNFFMKRSTYQNEPS